MPSSTGTRLRWSLSERYSCDHATLLVSGQAHVVVSHGSTASTALASLWTMYQYIINHINSHKTANGNCLHICYFRESYLVTFQLVEWTCGRIKEWWGKKGSGWETDYVVSGYLPLPHTTHPLHQIATILEESVIVFPDKLQQHSLLHGIVWSSPVLGSRFFSTPRPNCMESIGLWLKRLNVEVELQLAALKISATYSAFWLKANDFRARKAASSLR